MKKIISIVVILFAVGIVRGYTQHGAFIRIFNEKGKKCCKGRLLSVADSSFSVVHGLDTMVIPVSKVSAIGMKRGFGTATLNGALIGGGVFAILGAATADTDAFGGWSAGDGAAFGFFSGALTGAAVGLVIDATTKRPQFLIAQSQENWNKVKETLRGYSAEARANK